MHNRWFIEVDNENNWKQNFRIDLWFVDFDEAVEYAKTLIGKHESVRVVDECYGRVWWEFGKQP